MSEPWARFDLEDCLDHGVSGRENHLFRESDPGANQTP
jgi:hypothetical protein